MEWNGAMFFYILLCVLLASITGCLNKKQKLYHQQYDKLLDNTQDLTLQSEIAKIKAQTTKCLLRKQKTKQQLGFKQIETSLVNVNISDNQIIQYVSKKHINCLIATFITRSLCVLQTLYTFYNYCKLANKSWFTSLFTSDNIMGILLAALAVIVAIVIAVIQYDTNDVDKKQSAIETEKLQVQKNAGIVFREQQIASIVLENILMQFSKIFDSICVDAQVRQRQCINIKNTNCMSLNDCESVIVKLQASAGGLSCYDWSNTKITINKLLCHVIRVTDTVCELCITEGRNNSKVIDLLKQFSLRNNNPISITCIFDGLCVKAAEKAKNLFNPNDTDHVRYWEIGFSCIYSANTLHIAGDNNIKAILNFNEIQFLGDKPNDRTESYRQNNMQHATG